jgi:hypothetical protein
MLTTQEALDAMAGRSPEGKPLVFVSRKDFDALHKSYEDLLKTSKQRHRYLLGMSVVALLSVVIAISIVAAHPLAATHIEQFGDEFYTTNDVPGVHTANGFCAARNTRKHMHPLKILGSGVVFECVQSEEERSADARLAEKRDEAQWSFTPSAENRSRCVELRDSRKQLQANSGPLDEFRQVENLVKEEEALKCWSKP